MIANMFLGALIAALAALALGVAVFIFCALTSTIKEDDE